MQNKFKTENTVLPKDTKGKIGDLEQIDNFALKLNKCVNWFKKDKNGKEELPTTISDLQPDMFKAFLFKKTYDISTDKDRKNEFHLVVNAKFNTAKCESIRKNQREIAKSLCKQVSIVNEANRLELLSNWRLVVGLGNESVYETSMTLHHVYGIPYIPASGIKGVLHNWALNEVGLSEEDINGIFGTDEKAGKIIFFDAFPINLCNDSIQPDIINPHYPDYYDGEKPPADWQSPRPIFFLTLKDTNFEFIFGVKEDTVESKKLLCILTESEKGWLYKALKEQGIGAKTAVGYGRMFEKERVKPTYWDKPLKSIKRDIPIEAEIIGEKKVRLFISKDNTPEFHIKYCGESPIGTIVLIKVKSLKGQKGKESIDPTGLEYSGDK